MKRKAKILLIWAVLLMAVLPAALKAQIIYQCDFEDAQENTQWVLNWGARGPLCESKWYIGSPGQFGLVGDSGLYVSSDGQNATYKSTLHTAN